ncbi:unnamed protein product [Eruca vesicaria subsp. sativa]|uniref:Response regulatory domain-containing protein n=1 Tax=Eruca vesicaria subsp. sativa TaxID=29727 RepID=A0ABC8LKU8_ERUVS|nr:unnamed protein product [Eruca vesicaria subsp. sativa]
MGMAAEPQFHVLAVDDSLFDRKFIERLLQKASCQGNNVFVACKNRRKISAFFLGVFAVTTVDSAYKALEFLGLRESVESNDPDAVSTSPEILHQESSAFNNIPVVIMSSENVPARISSCLEEGAEEFFLKPVRLADLNKLKPLMMKTKLKNHKLEEIEKPSKDENGTVLAAAVEPEVKSLPLKSELETKQIHLQVVQQEEQTLSGNKRKSVEEGLSTDRSRPRFEGITTAV